MKTTIEDLEKNHAEALKKLERETQVSELLPESIRESASICIHGKFASVKAWNDFRTDKTLKDALEIYEAFKPQIVTGEHWKDGCVSTWPAAINSCIKSERATMDGSHAVEIEVQGGRGFGPYVAIQFWIDTEAGLIEVSLPVCNLHKLIPSVRASYNNHGELSSCDITWPQERSIVDSFRTFYAEKPGFNGHYYFADTFSFEAWASNQK